MTAPDARFEPDAADALFNSAGDKHITIGQASFSMTIEEWDQVKRWIGERSQERAMRWWSEQFGIPFKDAVGHINRVQIALEFKYLT